jgi:predicted SAM-dependent methyltransferase
MNYVMEPARRFKSAVKRHPALHRAVAAAARALRRWRAKSRNRTLIDSYFVLHPKRRINIGCGGYGHAGWLNCDFDPLGRDYLFVDASRPLPFPDACADFIFTEHMIEHLTLSDAQGFLGECARVLKPGGRIRVAMPDLDRFLGLFTRRDALGAAYQEWLSDAYFPDIPYRSEAMVLNNMLSNFGHRFVFDEKTMRLALETAGFTAVQRCPIGQSEHSDLCGLERHGLSIGDDMNSFETMVVEAVRAEA